MDFFVFGVGVVKSAEVKPAGECPAGDAELQIVASFSSSHCTIFDLYAIGRI